jgi:hypothetical protein
MRTIEINDRTADNLMAQAALRGVTVAEYLEALIPPASTSHATNRSLADLDAELEELTLELPTLPADFSRADIYEEHD